MVKYFALVDVRGSEKEKKKKKKAGSYNFVSY